MLLADIAAGLAGLLVGSFLNVVVDRLPRAGGQRDGRHCADLSTVLVGSLGIESVPKTRGDGDKVPIGGPQGRAGGELGRREKLRIHVADADPVKLMALDQDQDLGWRCDCGLRKAGKQPDDLSTLPEMA